MGVRRSVRLLMLSCAVVLSLGTGVARASSAAPVDVILLVETRRGVEQGVMRKYGLDTLAFGPRAAAPLGELQRVLSTEEVILPLVLRLACPAGTRREGCYNFQATRDVDFESALANVTAPTLIVVRPELGYWGGARTYRARYRIDLFSPQTSSDARYQVDPPRVPPRRARTFEVGYYEWNCAAECVRAAHENAAQELADMVAYMRDLEFEDDRRLPASWKELPKLKQTDQWARDCPLVLPGMRAERIVRQRERRFWLGGRGGTHMTHLDSVASTGCNSYAAGEG